MQFALREPGVFVGGVTVDAHQQVDVGPLVDALQHTLHLYKQLQLQPLHHHYLRTVA